MRRSTDRIITTHAGSMPRPDALLEANRAKLSGDGYNAQLFAERLSTSVNDIVRRQVELGIDVPNDGEFGKASIGPIDYGPWQSYAWERLGGWEFGQPGQAPLLSGRRDRVLFADFYKQLDGGEFVSSTALAPRPPVFNSPIFYRGQEAIKTDLANLKAACAKAGVEEGFVTSVAPGSFARRQDRYYKTEEEFLFGLAEALKEEYRAIVEAGFVLQLDDPGLQTSWDLANPQPPVEDYKKFAMLRIDALNHALQGLPEDRVRYHICWGSWHGPHLTDLPLKDIVDVMLKVRAGAFSLEAGNVRHEHEWKLWRGVKLPEGKVLIPGVVSHSTNVIEHPELVADRIVRFASVVGRENVIAGTDCGLGGRIHVSLVWAKMKALAEGAALATKELWGH